MVHRRGAASGAREQESRTRTGARSIGGQVGATSQTAPARETAAYGVRRADGIWITECAWCQRVRSVHGDWHHLTPDARAVRVVGRTHGICPECADACLARADELPNPWAE